MEAEVYIYGTFFDGLALDFVKSMEANKQNDIMLRLNSNGGDPTAGWSCLIKFAEHAKKKTVKVDGKALSMGFYFCCYTDNVECADVSEFLIHRAAYWFEGTDLMTDQDKQSLKIMNDKLRKAVEAKINVPLFEQITGVTLDQIFATDNRIDVELTAKQALQIGLVNKINTITPEAAAEINARVDRYAKAATTAGRSLHVTAATPTIPNPPHKPTTMDINELKNNHRAVYDAIFNAGQTAGKTAEADRVGAWMAFNDVDPEGVAKGIKEGAALSGTQMAELSRKAFSKEALKGLEKTNAPEIEPVEDIEKPAATAAAAAKTKAAAKVVDFEKAVASTLGIKN